jgi:hypothetical protein
MIYGTCKCYSKIKHSYKSVTTKTYKTWDKEIVCSVKSGLPHATVTHRVDGGVFAASARRLVVPEAGERLVLVQPRLARVCDPGQWVVVPVEETRLDRGLEPGEHLQWVHLVVAVPALAHAQALTLRHLRSHSTFQNKM